jgi:uncharacterized membrane protein
MIKKFPRKVNKKWSRFNRLEKVFIIYSILLPFLMFFLPIIKKVDLLSGKTVARFTIFNQQFWTLDIFVILLLGALILWNTSYRFRKFIYLLVGFRENEGLVNFAILFNLTMILLSIGSTIKLINAYFLQSIKLDYGFYVLSFYLIIGLAFNLILSLNFSTKKKKNHLITITSPKDELNIEEKVKQEVLFK